MIDIFLLLTVFLLAIESRVSVLSFNLSVIGTRSVFPILVTHPKYLTVVGFFEFLEWNEAHIVATILRMLG